MIIIIKRQDKNKNLLSCKNDLKQCPLHSFIIKRRSTLKSSIKLLIKMSTNVLPRVKSTIIEQSTHDRCSSSQYKNFQHSCGQHKSLNSRIQIVNIVIINMNHWTVDVWQVLTNECLMTWLLVQHLNKLLENQGHHSW